MMNMPMKVDKIKLKETQDRRRKLTDEQKEEIRNKYATGLIGQRPLAKEYGVSRKLIQLIVNDEIAERTKQRIKEHWRDYQDKDKHRVAIARTRAYKKELHEKGEI